MHGYWFHVLNITGCLNIIWLVYLKTIIIPMTKLISPCQCNITRLNLLALSEEPMLSSGFKAFQRGGGDKSTIEIKSNIALVCKPPAMQ